MDTFIRKEFGMIEILVAVSVTVLFILIAVRTLTEWGLEMGSGTHKENVIEASDGQVLKNENPRMCRVFLWGVIIRITIIIIGVIIVMIFIGEQRSFGDIIRNLQKWDAYHYINLIEKGYSGYIENGEHLFLVFFPAYVWISRVMRFVVQDTVLAGTLVSVLCYAGACCYIYKIALSYYNKEVAKYSIIYLSVFPFSFFSGFVMTEGLFLLVTSASCYYAINRKWTMFALFGIISSMTRMTGLLVIAFGVIEFFRQEEIFKTPIRQSLKRNLIGRVLKLLIIISPLIGTVIYLQLNYYVDGSHFAFVIHQQHWSQGFMWIPKVLGYLWDISINQINTTSSWQIQIPEVVIFVCSVIVLFISIIKKKAPAVLLAYAFVYLVANYSLSWLLSAGRYMSCCFPLFILLAVCTYEKRSLRTILIGVQAIFFGIYFTAYILGGQIM